MSEQDWLAYIPIGAGGSWARGKDRADTIRRCLKICKSDWSGLYDLTGQEVGVIVGDVRGHDQVYMDDTGIWTIPEDSPAGLRPERIYLPKDRVEVIRHIYPGRPQKKK